MTDLKFRIRSIIFPNWVYSNDHYKISYFFNRWDNQYINEPDYDPEMQQLINNEWIPVTPIVARCIK